MKIVLLWKAGCGKIKPLKKPIKSKLSLEKLGLIWKKDSKGIKKETEWKQKAKRLKQKAEREIKEKMRLE